VKYDTAYVMALEAYPDLNPPPANQVLENTVSEFGCN